MGVGVGGVICCASYAVAGWYILCTITTIRQLVGTFMTNIACVRRQKFQLGNLPDDGRTH
jgi:hypothetical protein